MSADDGAVQIRSYRVCFQLERRIHRLDRWRIPLPYGLPLRGLGYGAAILLAVLILDGLPVTGDLLGTLHPVLRYLALPIGGGYVLTELKVDGRTGHAVASSWLRLQLEPRRLSGFRRSPAPGQVRMGSVVVAPDDRSARMRKGVIRGAGAVVLRYPVALRPRGRTLNVRQQDGGPAWRGKQVNLRPGQRLVVR